MFFATCSLFRVVARIDFVDVLAGRGCVQWTGDAQRSAEGSPSDRCA
jgi:hypothetical protein